MRAAISEQICSALRSESQVIYYLEAGGTLRVGPKCYNCLNGLCAFWRRPRVIKGHWAGGRRPAPSNWCPFGQFNPGPATKWWLLPTPTV